MKRRLLLIVGLVIVLVLSLMGPAAMAAAQPSAMVKVLIGFDRQPGGTEQAVVRGVGGDIKYTYRLVPAIAASVPEAAILGLLRNPRVTVVEPDIAVYAIDAELDNTWGVKRIGAGTVHDGSNLGTGVKVAVIDSGIDYIHPDLAANYKGGYDFVNKDSNPMDDNGHGTHVAGTIAALNNDIGVVGVAPEAELYALKVLSASGSGSYSDVIAALQWAVDNGIQVTNNSYGSSGDPGTLVKAAFDSSSATGVLHIAAAGNNGNVAGRGDNVNYPARWGSVIAVAATDKNNNRASFSSTGPDVELTAPGVAINSTRMGGGYIEYNGTSMASPHVAGTAALIIAGGIADTNANGLINDEVRLILQQTADDIGSTGKDTLYGYGLVNAAAAVAAVVPPAPPEPSINVQLSTDKTSYVSGQDEIAVLTAVVTDENGNAVSGLTATAFVTIINGDVASVDFAEAATPGIYTGCLVISGLNEGTYELNVTVTDVREISGGATTSFSIVSAPPAPGTAYLAITMSTENRVAGRNTFTKAIAVVTVLDTNDTPIAGATISGSWSGLTSDTDSVLTNNDGVAVIESDQVKNATGTFTLNIVSVTKDGVTYDLQGDTSKSIVIP